MEDVKNIYLTFAASGNKYGVCIDKVVEILEYTEPKSKSANLPYLIGLTEHRDNVIPLIDTGLKFGLSAVEITPRTCTLVISINAGGSTFDVALAVDEVSDVIEVEDSAKQNIETNYKPGYVMYAIKHGAELILALNVDKIFTDTDIVSLKQILK
ncbi:MAG: chemotaxis protein CheW [Bacteroidales bacterium]|nr:chemotaxis protein CheW [Bacteroidales bacterium]